jgi:DNA-binding response OmpR family regulator
MPNLDGLALLRVMSEHGTSDYIRKPIHTEVLLLRVRNVLRDGAP